MEEDQSQGVPIQSLIEAGVVGLAQGNYSSLMNVLDARNGSKGIHSLSPTYLFLD